MSKLESDRQAQSFLAFAKWIFFLIWEYEILVKSSSQQWQW